MTSHFPSKHIKKYICLLAVVVVLTIAFLCSSTVATVIHAIINVFATGRSNTKSLLFIWYPILLAIALLSSGKFSAHRKKLTSVAYWCLGLVGLAYLLDLIFYVRIVLKEGIPFWTYAVIDGNNSLTSMQFLHNHAFKGTIGIWTNLFLGHGLRGIDDGTAVLGLIPSWMFFIGSLVAAAAVIGLVVGFVVTVKAHEEKTKKRHILYVILYTLASFMVIKSIFDGGPLSFEAIVGCSFLLIIFGRWINNLKIIGTCLITGYILFVGLLFWYGYFPTPNHYTYHVFSTLCAFIVLVALYSWTVSSKTRLTILISVMALVAVCIHANNDLYAISYRAIPINQTDGAYAETSSMMQDSSYDMVGSIGYLNWYFFKPQNDTTTVSDVLSQVNEADNLEPVFVPWVTCLPKGPDDVVTADLNVSGPLSVTSVANNLYSMNAVLESKNDGIYQYALTVKAPPCRMGAAVMFIDAIIGQYAHGFSFYNISTVASVDTDD